MLLSVQVGQPRTMPWDGGPGWGAADEWTSSIHKVPVEGGVWLAAAGLTGDAQADLVNHGGPDKAVNVYASEHYAYWERDLPARREDLARWGAFGENFTARGLLEHDVCIGDVFAIGVVQVQVSQPRQPCWKLARRLATKDLVLRVQQTGYTGWYFRVLREGEVRAGEAITRVARPHPEWTVAAANEVMHQRRRDVDAARALAACPALSASWRATLRRRVEGEDGGSEARRMGAS
jgi:MOSC domain-containing protein YiiM